MTHVLSEKKSNEYLLPKTYRQEETSSRVETSEGAQKIKRRRSHTHVFLFLYRLFPSNFRLGRHILKDSSPILEHQEIREPLPSFKGFLKCMAPIACIYFTKYKSFQHFILPELC